MFDWMMGTLADNDADEARSARYYADDFDLDRPDAAELAELENEAPAEFDPNSPWAAPVDDTDWGPAPF